MIIPIEFNDDDNAYSDRAEDWMETAEAAATGDVAVYAVGDLSGDATFGAIAEEDLSKEVSIGLPVAGIVLVIVFGALIAPILPLAIGLVSIAITSGFVLLLALRRNTPSNTPRLGHHTVLFPEDYDAEFDDVFGRTARPRTDRRPGHGPPPRGGGRRCRRCEQGG